MARAERSATFREAFAVAEFRALLAALLLSVVGDQFARVALAVVVFDRTGSAGLTALTYGLTYLPDLVGGPLLSGLADRYPRRAVMVTSDLARAALVAVMAVPGMPLVWLGVLLVGVQLLNAPFGAARAATLPAVLDGDRFVVGSAASNTLVQVAQLVGFASGGVLVTAIGPGRALLVDAATFAVSAAIIRYGVLARPAVGDRGGASWWASVRGGVRLVGGEPRLRSLVALACVAGFYITAEGLAVPYAAELGGGAVAAGALLAAGPAGTVLGMLAVSRLVPPEVRLRWMGPMAVAACAPLVLCALRPGLVVTVVLWTASGVASAYHLVASAAFVRAVPDSGRGQAFGLAVTALRVSQGAGIVLAGLAAERALPSTVVAWCGALGMVAALAAAGAWRRSGQASRESDP